MQTNTLIKIFLMAMILMVIGTDKVLVFEHDSDIPASTVGRDTKGRCVITPVTV